MKILALICRILLGLVFVVFGANAIHPFLTMPLPPAGSPPAVFFGLFFSSGWIKVIGLFELLGGLLVLFGGTVPLGLSFLAPVLLNIWCYHVLLAGGAGLVPMPIVVTLLWLILIYAYRANFAGIFTTKATPTA